MVVEHRVANVDVYVQEARTLGRNRGHPRAKVPCPLARALQAGSMAKQGNRVHRPTHRGVERGGPVA